MVKAMNWNFNDTILTISDAHAPYNHPDFFPFMDALKRKYRPKLTVSMGDLVDYHGISFHDSDPDILSAGDELRAAQKFCQKLEKLFPNLIVIGSNHGDLPLRKLLAHGLPKHLLRPYNDIYGVKKWQFVDDLTLKSKDQTVYFAHGITKDGIKLVAQRGVCTIQGHWHTTCRIEYLSTPQNLLWSMQVGCLIDKQALAFAYDKLNLTRPIIATGVIVGGLPKLEPMILNKKGRWVGKLGDI